jgi:pimeloyl-ACP methyl ester carboxylesterase
VRKRSVARSRRSDRAARPLATGSAIERLDEAELERLFQTGERRPELENYFGAEQYERLRRLAQRGPRAAAKRGGQRVLILPGIMGSSLSLSRDDDLLWFDALDVHAGRLGELRLPDGGSVRAQGALALFYLQLKWRLRLAGFDVDDHPFDWRQDIVACAKGLAARIAKEGRGVMVVAHSMGGLVARAAMKQGASIDRLIMLGTPNQGSWAIPLAIRGEHPLVETLARLAGTPAEELSKEIFSTFVGLTQMLPSRKVYDKHDLFSRATWPDSAPQPLTKPLAAARALGDALAPADGRMIMIVGVGRETIVDMDIREGRFVYRSSVNGGDGTVPQSYAVLDGVPTYFTNASHGVLPNNWTVGSAIIDLLKTGRTDELSAKRGLTIDTAGPTREVAPQKLRLQPPARATAAESEAEMGRHALDDFVATDTGSAGTDAPSEGAGPAWSSQPIVVGRRRQRRLDITLAFGSITEINTRAIVIGTFASVVPVGPASAIDAVLGGVIRDVTERRMFASAVGETFVLPLGRSRLPADLVVLVGLGNFDTFSSQAQKTVTENLARLLARTNVEEIATVLLGTSARLGVRETLESMLVGFLHGLDDVDGHGRFRHIIFCEHDQGRFDEIRQTLRDLSSSYILDDVELTISTRTLPPPAQVPVGRQPDNAIYLMVRKEGGDAGDRSNWQATLLGVKERATVGLDSHAVSKSALKDLLKPLEVGGAGISWDKLPDFGRSLTDLVLPKDVQQALARCPDQPLVVLHDAVTSRVPWEALRVARAGADKGAGGEYVPALAPGLIRQYLARSLSVAKWRETRRRRATLEVLLVVDPTDNLPGAALEGERVGRALADAKGVVVRRTLTGKEATREILRREIGSGAYDVIHYAGHAHFDPDVPGESGILCANNEVLSGADLAGIGELPALAFFNACQVGRIRGGGPRAGAKPNRRQAAAGEKGRRKAERTDEDREPLDPDEAVSFAEAFLRGGIASFVGTFWPVSDQAAVEFASAFYASLIAGQTVRDCVQAGRERLNSGKFPDWANYIHYGTPNFAVKIAAPDEAPPQT